MKPFVFLSLVLLLPACGNLETSPAHGLWKQKAAANPGPIQSNVYLKVDGEGVTLYVTCQFRSLPAVIRQAPVKAQVGSNELLVLEKAEAAVAMRTDRGSAPCQALLPAGTLVKLGSDFERVKAFDQ